jgi:hypothetical protein
MVALSVPSAWAERNPEFPRDLHGLWWDPLDSGWATAVFDHATAMSSALLVYDPDGRPTWAVSPKLDCYRDQPPFILVECSGKLYQVTGTWFGASAFRASDVTVREVGDWYGAFQTPLFGGVGPNLERRLDLLFNVDGWGISPHGQKPLKIQAIDPNGSFLWQDGTFTGLWGTPGENGWGVGIFVENNSLQATLFVHGPDKQPRWYVVFMKDTAQYETRPDRIFEGQVYETRGYPRGSELVLNGASSVRQVGGASLHFGEKTGDPATLRYSIDGVQVQKTIYKD